MTQAPARTVHGAMLEVVATFLEEAAGSAHRRLADHGDRSGVVGVAVSTVDDTGPVTVGASTRLAGDVDRTQFRLGDGPCLQTLRTGVGLHVADLAADERWGEYGRLAAARGAGCCVSVPVVVEGRTVAVLKAYGAVPHALGARQRELAATIAVEVAGGFALAAHLVRLSTELDDLTALVAHRRVIDLALGISMERAQVDAATAFGLLRTRSQHDNTRLHEVAAAVVATVPGASAADLVPPYDPRGGTHRR